MLKNHAYTSPSSTTTLTSSTTNNSSPSLHFSSIIDGGDNRASLTLTNLSSTLWLQYKVQSNAKDKKKYSVTPTSGIIPPCQKEEQRNSLQR